MQRTAISRGNVDAISEKQNAQMVIYHSHSQYRCEQMHLGIKCIVHKTMAVYIL